MYIATILNNSKLIDYDFYQIKYMNCAILISVVFVSAPETVALECGPAAVGVVDERRGVVDGIYSVALGTRRPLSTVIPVEKGRKRKIALPGITVTDSQYCRSLIRTIVSSSVT